MSASDAVGGAYFGEQEFAGVVADGFGLADDHAALFGLLVSDGVVAVANGSELIGVVVDDFVVVQQG